MNYLISLLSPPGLIVCKYFGGGGGLTHRSYTQYICEFVLVIFQPFYTQSNTAANGLEKKQSPSARNNYKERYSSMSIFF